MVRRKLISGEELMAKMDFAKKKPLLTNVDGYYAEEAQYADCLTDHALYMMWRDAILSNGHTPTRYLNRPKNKELEMIRIVHATFMQGFKPEGFPYFLNEVFARFEEVKAFISKHSGGHMLFEVHMMGMFHYHIPYILLWFGNEYTDEYKDESLND